MKYRHLPQAIEKENISQIKFKEDFKFRDKEEKTKLNYLLHNAMVLGNISHGKVKIIFESNEGTKQVETTVWAATKNNIVLKGGVVIPIDCIMDVKLF